MNIIGIHHNDEGSVCCRKDCRSHRVVLDCGHELHELGTAEGKKVDVFHSKQAEKSAEKA